MITQIKSIFEDVTHHLFDHCRAEGSVDLDELGLERCAAYARRSNRRIYMNLTDREGGYSLHVRAKARTQEMADHIVADALAKIPEMPSDRAKIPSPNASENLPHEERLRAVFENCTNAGACEEADVNQVEADLGVLLPPSYRYFLLEFGASGLVAPFEIAGVDRNRSEDTPPMFYEVIEDTIEKRERAPDGTFDDLVFISSAGMSHDLFLDTSRQDKSGECPVVVITPEAEREEVASSFVEFVELAFFGDPIANLRSPRNGQQANETREDE